MALYNGNISETYWKSSSDNVLRKYGYKYDALNRLKDAFYMKPTTSTQSGTFLNSYDEHLTYDKNGNIISLDRTGDLDSNTTFIFIDELYYLYDTNSNKLRSVDDSSNHPEGFTNAVDVTQEYDYDAFGNMIQDLNKGINSITYNHLNLPKKITYSTSIQNISYLYNALGVKLQKKVYREGQTTPFIQPPYTITTDYLGGFHYEFHDNPNLIGNNGMVFFATSEGYVNVTTNRSVSYNYVYNYTDHLGNVRVSYTNGTGGAATILEENHYYPFGLKHKKYGSTVKNFVEIEDGDGYYVGVETVPPGARKTYQYKYQGQERQDELGLNWDSFKWRNYDYAIGRFFNIDPLSEKYAYQSHYNFSENRVVDSRELEGLEKVSIHLLGKISSELNGTRQITGNVSVDMGNNNSVVYRLAVEGIGTIKGSYTQESGHNFTLSETNKNESREDAWASTRVKGIKIPDFAAKWGINKALEEINPKTVEEALSLTPEEIEMNSTVSYILNSAYQLIDKDIMDVFWTYDGSKSQGTDSKGEKYNRKFTNSYSGKFDNLKFSYKNFTFIGYLIINYTEEVKID